MKLDAAITAIVVILGASIIVAPAPGLYDGRWFLAAALTITLATRARKVHR